MRKITLVAIAALSASTALAALPGAKTATIASNSVQNKLKIEKFQKAAVSSRADEGTTGTTIADSDPNYYTPTGFYTGLSSAWYQSNTGSCVMITPSRGVTKFVPTQQLTDSKWEWTEYVVNEEGTDLEPKDFYADTDTLEYENYPYTQTETFMTLSGNTAANQAVSYVNPKVLGLLAGRNYNEWTKKDASAAEGVYGLTPVSSGLLPLTSEDAPYIWGGQFGFNKTDEGAINGVLSDVTDEFTKEGYDCSDIKLVAYAATMPSPGSYYQLGSIYFLCRSVNAEDLSINVEVYEIDEENKISEKPVGKGSATIPACQPNAQTGKLNPFGDFLTIDLSAVNILGYTTNRPICSDKALYLTITGFGGESVESFYIMTYGTQRITQAEWAADSYWRKLYPSHAQVLYSLKDKTTGETVVESDDHVYAYYAEDSKDADLLVANNFFLYYNLYFPQIYNAQTGLDSYEANVTDGSAKVYVDGSYDFAQLIADGFMLGDKTAEWISYEVSYDEANEVTVIEVSGEALPEGKTGRTGYINFTGEACDFSIKVIQGDGSAEEGSINEIAGAAQGGATEYFDLQGRKLSAAPAKGVYIQRNGATATKLVK